MKNNFLTLLMVLALLLSSCSLAAAEQSKDKTPSKKKANTEEYELEQVKLFVKSYQSQITKIYSRHSAIVAQHGTLSITLYISEKGKVVDTTVEPKSGRFSTALLRDIKNKTLEWKFNNTQKLIYTFSLRLSKD